MKCPACHNLKTDFFFQARNFHGSRQISEERFVILRCPVCGLVFPRIRPAKDFYRRYYPQDYFKEGNFIFKATQSTSQMMYFYGGQIFLNRFIGRGKILDFGCGPGDFLRFLPKRFEKYGVEINPLAIKFIKKNLPEIHLFADLSLLRAKKQRFDRITLWHVIEHLDQPQKILKQLSSLLEKDGLLVLSTPNSQSLGLKLTRDNWFHLDAPIHLAIFNQDNLKEICKKANLEVVKIMSNLLEYPLDLFRSLRDHYKTKNSFINSCLAPLFLVVSVVIKTGTLFLPRNSEVIIFICRKAN